LKTVAVVQPSYIPWRGFFDLIRRSDTFVFYDDVQYDKSGWRNRNQIKTASGLQWLTIPVHAHGNVDEGTPINRIAIDDRGDWRRKHLESIRHAYRKAPFFEETFAFLTGAYAANGTELLADVTVQLTIRIAERLGFRREFLRSSQLEGISGTKTDRLLQTLEKVGATHYLSGPSARSYIEPGAFERAHIGLEYMQYAYRPYPQLHGGFEPFVSIVDLLMMTGPQAPEWFE
jgi:hypothetical protein